MAYNIKGNTGDWEYVIGLEIHAQIISKSKLFSQSPADFSADTNTHILLDIAMPGMLPVLNKICIEQAIKTGIALNGHINNVSVFDRKNYFYPDLPQGYQISQFYTPIVENGYLSILCNNECEKNIRINRIHLEQDAGRSIHDQHPKYSLIDFNRSGVALMEIVTEPDLRSPEEATQFIKKLRSVLRYVGSCNGNMEKGAMRCDANVSVRKPGSDFGIRCEIKNLNSIKNINKAIEYEALRQIHIIENGGVVDQETRLFDINAMQTKPMRSKEEAKDYRYFPDPDLLPVVVDDELITKMRNELPELPDEKINRYVSKLGLSTYDAEVLVADKTISQYFEEAIINANPKIIANWISSELFAKLRKHNITLEECKITPNMLSELISLLEKELISGKIAKSVFEEMFNTGESAIIIVKNKGLEQVSDHSFIEPIIQEVISNNPESVKAYKEGKEKLLGFFVGQVMKKTSGKASPKIVNTMLKTKLQTTIN